MKVKKQLSASSKKDPTTQAVHFDKNIMAIKVGKRPVLMYDDGSDEEELEKPRRQLTKQQESKLREMIDEDFLYSEIDKAYESKATAHKKSDEDQEEIGNRYANEPRVYESGEDDDGGY